MDKKTDFTLGNCEIDKEKELKVKVSDIVISKVKNNENRLCIYLNDDIGIMINTNNRFYDVFNIGGG